LLSSLQAQEVQVAVGFGNIRVPQDMVTQVQHNKDTLAAHLHHMHHRVAAVLVVQVVVPMVIQVVVLEVAQVVLVA
jgi:hypothetical protein